MRTFNPHAERTARSVQAWQILVGKAMNRQTVTYLGLSILMFKKAAAGVLDETLGNIAFYCNEHGLPALTSIVVGKTRGTPGHDIPIDLAAVDKEREKVYEYDWYNVYPPGEEELKDARRRQENKP
jgi:hypothetical protein